MKIIYLFLFFSSTLNFLISQNEYRILVFDFDVIGDSLTKDDGKIFANSIKVDFVKKDKEKQIKVLERENLAKILQDRSEVQKSPNLFDENYAVEIGKLVEANYLILGQLSKTKLHSGILVSVRIVSAKTGTIEYANEVSISNNNDYQEVVNLITGPLMDRIEYDNKSEKEKNKAVFFTKLNNVIQTYTDLSSNFLNLKNLENIEYIDPM